MKLIMKEWRGLNKSGGSVKESKETWKALDIEESWSQQDTWRGYEGTLKNIGVSYRDTLRGKNFSSSNLSRLAKS